jgi:hypothetical protein
MSSSFLFFFFFENERKKKKGSPRAVPAVFLVRKASLRTGALPQRSGPAVEGPSACACASICPSFPLGETRRRCWADGRSAPWSTPLPLPRNPFVARGKCARHTFGHRAALCRRAHGGERTTKGAPVAMMAPARRGHGTDFALVALLWRRRSPREWHDACALRGCGPSPSPFVPQEFRRARRSEAAPAANMAFWVFSFGMEDQCDGQKPFFFIHTARPGPAHG